MRACSAGVDQRAINEKVATVCPATFLEGLAIEAHATCGSPHGRSMPAWSGAKGQAGLACLIGLTLPSTGWLPGWAL